MPMVITFFVIQSDTYITASRGNTQIEIPIPKQIR
jgi:hypothetical protein